MEYNFCFASQNENTTTNFFISTKSDKHFLSLVSLLEYHPFFSASFSAGFFFFLSSFFYFREFECSVKTKSSRRRKMFALNRTSILCFVCFFRSFSLADSFVCAYELMLDFFLFRGTLKRLFRTWCNLLHGCEMIHHTLCTCRSTVDVAVHVRVRSVLTNRSGIEWCISFSKRWWWWWYSILGFYFRTQQHGYRPIFRKLLQSISLKCACVCFFLLKIYPFFEIIRIV